LLGAEAGGAGVVAWVLLELRALCGSGGCRRVVRAPMLVPALKALLVSFPSAMEMLPSIEYPRVSRVPLWIVNDLAPQLRGGALVSGAEGLVGRLTPPA